MSLKNTNTHIYIHTGIHTHTHTHTHKGKHIHTYTGALSYDYAETSKRIQCLPGNNGLFESISAKIQPTDQTSTETTELRIVIRAVNIHYLQPATHANININVIIYL